jgi:hypothetical protein
MKKLQSFFSYVIVLVKIFLVAALLLCAFRGFKKGFL